MTLRARVGCEKMLHTDLKAEALAGEGFAARGERSERVGECAPASGSPVSISISSRDALQVSTRQS